MSYNRKLAGIAAAALLGIISLAGCDSNDSATYGTVQVKLTDAPIDEFSEANITINRIVLVGDEETGLGEGYVLFDGSFTANLLDLQNGIDTLLVRDEVPVGSYSQLRVIVDEDAVVRYLADSTTETLKIPSGSTSGIKINLPKFEINENEDVVEVLIDFDLNRSFVKAGNSGKYIFKPVIKPLSLVVNSQPLPVDTTAATIDTTAVTPPPAD